MVSVLVSVDPAEETVPLVFTDGPRAKPLFPWFRFCPSGSALRRTDLPWL